MDAEQNIVSCPPGKGRKKIRKQSKREKLKIARYSAKQLPLFPNCGHSGKPGLPYFCSTLKMQQVKRFHEILYSSADKVKQDTFILKCCTGKNPKRTNRNKRRNSQVSIEYNIPDDKGNFVRVCKNAFLRITGISRFRIERIVKNFVIKNEIPKERRGGDRVGNKNNDKKNQIKQFMESLTCVESHYCRSKSSERRYLPCELNFKKLYGMYLSKIQENCVRLSYFRDYVKKNYNLGFGSPKSDVCSTCLRSAEMLKTIEVENDRKTHMVEQRIHKLKAKAFYKLLKTEDPCVQNFSFDCQKNLALPKLPDQACYFSQQLNFNHLAVVARHGDKQRSNLSPPYVFSYVWLETDAPKDSNTISSAMYHLLKRFDFIEGTTKVRLFADGCGGQNKNTIIMAMLSSWLLKDAPKTIETLEFIFPMVGHSYMPPDRVFGLVERYLKKETVIVTPQQYEEVIEKYATVRRTDEWSLFDWRGVTSEVFKKPGGWHFAFNKSKRFILTRQGNVNVQIRGETNYCADVGVFKGVCKRGKNISLLSPKLLPYGKTLKGDKSSIDKLLTAHFGDNWQDKQELVLYKKVLYPSTEDNLENNSDDDEVALEGEECRNPAYGDFEI